MSPGFSGSYYIHCAVVQTSLIIAHPCLSIPFTPMLQEILVVDTVVTGSELSAAFLTENPKFWQQPEVANLHTVVIVPRQAPQVSLFHRVSLFVCFFTTYPNLTAQQGHGYHLMYIGSMYRLMMDQLSPCVTIVLAVWLAPQAGCRAAKHM